MNQDSQITTSLSLAAYLGAIGIDCVGIEKVDTSQQLSFIFNISSDRLNELADLFWSKKSSIDALTYFEALKVLKSRIYQYKNQERQHERTTSF